MSESTAEVKPLSGLATNILELLQQRDSDELSDPAWSVVDLSDKVMRTEEKVRETLLEELEPAGLAIEIDADHWCVPADPEDIGEAGWAEAEDAVRAEVEVTPPVPVNWQLLPPLTSDEYDALKEDIGQRGVLVPVEVDEDGNLLDGHHRMRAVAELRSQGVNVAEPKRIVRKGWSDEQKRQHVYTINLARRALTREQKQDIAARLRGEGWTLEAVARALGVSIDSAHRWTRDLNSEIGNQTITNARGQERPATYAPREQPALDVIIGDPEPEPHREPEPVSYRNQTETIPAEEPPAAQAHPARRTDDRQTWATPQALFDVLDEEFDFTLDAAADDSNHKCERYFTAETDGLAQSWAGEVVYCNPPYGDKAAWVRKGYLAAAEDDATVVLLIPATPDTALFWDYCRQGEVRFIRGRLRFDDGDAAAPFPSCLVIFYPGVRSVDSDVLFWEGWSASEDGE